MHQPTRRDLLAAGVAALLGFGCRRREPLPELGRLPEFSLLDQEGKAFGSKELRDRVWIAAFFFTRCPTVCPRLTAEMRKLQERAKAEQVAVHFVSFSVDPDHDTPAVLKQFARTHRADLASWTFLTGDQDVIKKTAVDGFKLAVEGKADPAAEHFGLLHGSHVVLVDRTLSIRGYYRSEDPDEHAKLLVDARSLSG